MAIACDVLQPLIDTLTCPICFSVLSEPRSLPCGHTFCLNCIERVCELRGGDSDYDGDDDYSFGVHVPCPVCRQPFSTSVHALPANFVVQNVIVESFRPSVGFCQICCRKTKLELATVKCRDCLENLCDSCSAQHADGKHTCVSLTEQKCDKHNQKLELYCIGCRCNICVVCFSETHRSHKCDAISKLAEQLINALKNYAEALRSCRSRLDAVLTNIMRQKKKYVRHLEECLNIRATGQRSGAAKEDPRLVNKQTKVHDLIKKKLKAANEMIQRNTADADINGDKVRGLIQDVSVILGVVILKLSNHVGRLQNVLSDFDKLQTTADDVIRSGFSAHEVTNNALTIGRLGKQTNVLLQDRTLHPYLECSCTENATFPILSREVLDDLESLLKQASALKDLLHYEQLPASSSPSFVHRLLLRRRRRPQQQRKQSPETRQECTQPSHDRPATRRRPPAVLPKPRLSEKQKRDLFAGQPPSQQPQQQRQMMDELTSRLSQRAARSQADGTNRQDLVTAAVDNDYDDDYRTIPTTSVASNHAASPVDDVEDELLYGELPVDQYAMGYDFLPTEQNEYSTTPYDPTDYMHLPAAAGVTGYVSNDDDTIYNTLPTLPYIDAASDIENSSYVVALYDYRPEACDEITLHVGDIITELEYSEEEDWLCGTAPDGTRGLFPVNFVTSTFHLVPDAWG